MIYDGKNPNYAEVVKYQKYKDKGGSISCGHDFWEQARKMEFGDVVLCNQCHQYFAKIRHMPWITLRYKWLEPKTPANLQSIGTNHLGYRQTRATGDYMFQRKEEYFMTPVHVRVTD